jgi:putative membrane protein
MVNERLVRAGVATVSAGVLAFLLWLLYARPEVAGGSGGASPLPAVNAVFNTLCVVFLLAGYHAIRHGNRRRHVTCMLVALACSALFLIGYVTHHFLHGDTPFAGQGWVRPVYFTVLVSHVLVTVVALPMILTTLVRAASGDFERHRWIARRTLPVWLYVSVTGVMIFIFLRGWS